MHSDSQYVWGIVAGVGGGAAWRRRWGGSTRSTYYALRDTRTPLRFAMIRVVLTTALGYVCALPVPRWLGIDPRWGVAGLTASAGVAGWVEFTLLRRALNRRIGQTGLPASLVARLWASAGVAAAVAWGVRLALGSFYTGPTSTFKILASATGVLGAYGVVYFGVTYLLGVEECRRTLRRFV